MIGAIQNLVRAADAAVARAYLSVLPEKDGLLCFLFHSLFRDERQIEQNAVNPLERTTVAQFRELIEYYLAIGYRFIVPGELLEGLKPDGKYAMITFDDGYYNNLQALPVLEELDVPAIFFISTKHIARNKCFWWDVFYREQIARGVPARQVHRQTVHWKSMRTEDIERELLSRFGPNSLKPRGDIDRPFTAAELRTFAQNKYVHLGNHTADHAILTNYCAAQVREQVSSAQEWLAEIIGRPPVAIAYPNGAHNDRVVDICAQAGLKIGFTIRPGKMKLPIQVNSRRMMRVNRFVPHAESPILSQCRTYRSDLQIYAMLRGGYLRLRPGRPGQ